MCYNKVGGPRVGSRLISLDQGCNLGLPTATLKQSGMKDRRNSFEPALPCRPRTCLSTTLQANLIRRASPFRVCFRVVQVEPSRH